jgi:hypothetical protein
VTDSAPVPERARNRLPRTWTRLEISAQPLTSPACPARRSPPARSAKKLVKGTYHLVASYLGSFGFAASASKSATLKVTS